MDRPAAIKQIKGIFSTYKNLQPSDAQLLNALKKGKLYERYVLSWLVQDLVQRGFVLIFKGNSLQFKASPGKIKNSDPHFEISCPNSNSSPLYLFVDIEFETLGSTQVAVTDKSLRHEIDIVVVDVDNGYPSFGNIALGVECKAVANFAKSILKEVLGVRRELSFFQLQTPSSLSQLGGVPAVLVPAQPPSEYWLAYLDPAGNAYGDSPRAFGVEFKFCPI